MANKPVPPNNVDAEQSILGGLLIGGELPELDSSDFYRPQHRPIWDAIVELLNQQKPVDLVTVTNLLKENGRLEEAGGASYVAGLADNIPSTKNIGHYAGIVRECSLKRRIMDLGRHLYHGALDTKSFKELLSEAHQEIAELGAMGTKPEFRTYKELAMSTMKTLEARAKSPHDVSGIPTPWRWLNKLTNGFQAGELVLIAGRPSMGKSAACQQIVEYVALTTGPAALFSLEMSAEALMERALSREASIDSQALRTGRIQSRDWPILVKGARRLATFPISINDNPLTSVSDIRFNCRKLAMEQGPLAMIAVDYTGLVKITGRSRVEEVGQISSQCKAIAREMNCPLLLVSQLNRKVEERENKRPRLADLRESGDLEQDADKIIFIYRDEVYNSESPYKGIAEFNVAKYRNGPTGVVKLVWFEKYTRFGDLIYEST